VFDRNCVRLIEGSEKAQSLQATHILKAIFTPRNMEQYQLPQGHLVRAMQSSDRRRRKVGGG
jgi:hypothetical protein